MSDITDLTNRQSQKTIPRNCPVCFEQGAWSLTKSALRRRHEFAPDWVERESPDTSMERRLILFDCPPKVLESSRQKRASKLRKCVIPVCRHAATTKLPQVSTSPHRGFHTATTSIATIPTISNSLTQNFDKLGMRLGGFASTGKVRDVCHVRHVASCKRLAKHTPKQQTPRHDCQRLRGQADKRQMEMEPGGRKQTVPF